MNGTDDDSRDRQSKSEQKDNVDTKNVVVQHDSGVEQPSEKPQSESTDTGETYEVVLSIDGGYTKEHAELLRKRLLADGFFNDVVTVREKPDAKP